MENDDRFLTLAALGVIAGLFGFAGMVVGLLEVLWK